MLKDIEKVELVIGRGGSHLYKPASKPEERYPSVTTVTGGTLAKPALVGWAKRVALEAVRAELLEMNLLEPKTDAEVTPLPSWPAWVDGVIERAKKRPEQIAEEAADIGTRAHGIIDDMLKGTRPMGALAGLPADVFPCVQGFMEWWRGEVLEYVGSEIRLCSHKLKVGGSMDLLVRSKGKLVVGDFKTSKAIYPEYFFQVGGYALCIEEMTGEKVKEAWLIRFPKTKDDPVPFELVKVGDLAAAKRGFAELVGVYRKLKAFDAQLKGKA